MRAKAYEIRKAQGGYGVFELGILDSRVVSETKIAEYDFLLIALTKLTAYLSIRCPEQKIYKPAPVKDLALPANTDEILKEHEADAQN
jgi:hypothetical protein